MWCTRYYACLRAVKIIYNIEVNGLRCSSRSNFVKSSEKVDGVNNEATLKNLSSLRITPQTEERGYVKESRVDSSNNDTLRRLHDSQKNLNNLIPNVETVTNELNICDEDIKLPGPLDPCTEDVSDIGSVQLPSYNIAKYANTSRTIQELMKLGVNLHRHETDVKLMEFLLRADFEKDLSPYIRFLHDCGIPADYLGVFLSKNLHIFSQDMDDLHTRVRYLRFHDFSIQMIKTIICKSPTWLNFSTKHIDTRLGYFQNNFKLSGQQIRELTVKKPKLIIYPMESIYRKTFAIKEEMGFNKDETRQLLLTLPDLWIKSKKCIVETFDYAHNVMKLSHARILSEPHILTCRKRRVENRHSFLEKLGKAQYDPTKPLYVSLNDLVHGSDVEFCTKVAKTNIEVYDLYLKTI